MISCYEAGLIQPRLVQALAGSPGLPEITLQQQVGRVQIILAGNPDQP
jgi:hypothetical protein